jgi:hypothetical protein
MYEPKLSLDDAVWVMQNNKPTQLIVVEIEVMCRGGFQKDIDWFVKYTLTGGHTLHESTPNFPGDFIFRTKDELIKHLYENS